MLAPVPWYARHAMSCGSSALAHCALRVALRRRFAARPAPPVRVHRCARLVRSAADTASFAFDFREGGGEDEAAPPAADASLGELSRAIQSGALDVALALLGAAPPSSRNAAASDSCARLVTELCNRGRYRDAERAFQLSASHGTGGARCRVATRLTQPAGLVLSEAVGKALLRALLDAQEVERAVAVFRLQQQHAQPPAAAYTDLILCVPSTTALVSSRGLADAPGRIAVSCRSLTRAVKADGRPTNSSRAAVHLWEELRNSGQRLDNAAFCAAAGAYVADGQLGRARGLVGDAVSCGLTPSARMCGSSGLVPCACAV